MQVTKTNFKETLPVVSEAINESSFLAIDAEFSGLDTGQSIHAFDTLQERYQKQRKAAKAFIIVQFGLSAFRYSPEDKLYKVQSFNFYICPRPYGRHAPDTRFQCQSSSMDFLSSQGLDFNKVFRDGISYLLPTETQKLIEAMKQRHEKHKSFMTPSSAAPASLDAVTPTAVISKLSLGAADGSAPSPRDPIAIPEQHQPFIAKILKQIEEFVLQTEVSFLDLEPCNGYMRKLTYQAVQQKYGKKLRLEAVNTDRRQHIRVTISKTTEEYEQLERNRQMLEYEELDDATGFSKVIKLVSQSGKLVVGHNMILDMLHIVEHFVNPLPEDYEEFKDLFRCVFPRILDTKVMATSQQLKDLLPNTTLADMQRDLEKAPFSKPKVVDAGIDVGYSNNSERLHEAGYDSYITGLCFISMTDYLGSIAKPPVTHIQADSPVIKQFWNKLFLMRMTDISFINLEGPDAKISRDHVFHLTFPATWKAENISHLFSSFGNVQIAWLDDSSAFVGLYRRDQADAVVKFLMSVPDRAYRILTYAQYFEMSALTKTPNTATSTMNAKRKLPALEVDVSPSPIIFARQKSSRSSRCSNEVVEEELAEVEESVVEACSVEDEIMTKNGSHEPSKKKSRLSFEDAEEEDNSNKMFEEPAAW